jgi:hypothetical protein
MKSINTTLALATIFFLAQACGRRADPVSATKSYNQDNNATVAAFTSPEGSPSEDVRAATILVYPDPADVAGLTFNPSADATNASNWEIILNELSYRNSLITNFTPAQEPFTKAKEIAKLILAAGQTRDNALRTWSSLNQQENNERDAIPAREAELGINSTSFEAVKCYYDENDYSYEENIYRCKLAPEGTYTTETVASDCSSFARYQYLDTLNAEGVQLKQNCTNVLKTLLDVQKQAQHQIRVREAGENMVLNLLLQTEQTTKRVFVATASTTEKPGSSGGPASQIKFNREFTEVESMKLFIEFLGPYASVSSRQEYSYCNDGSCNGKISTPVVTFKQLRDRTYPQVAFTLTLPDMEIDVKADVSYEAGVMGLRMIDSKTFVRYNDGTKRRGVFKIEAEVL